jgi:hypothetical protein
LRIDRNFFGLSSVLKTGRFYMAGKPQTGTNLLTSGKADFAASEELGKLSQILPDLVTVLQLSGHEVRTIWLL